MANRLACVAIVMLGALGICAGCGNTHLPTSPTSTGNLLPPPAPTTPLTLASIAPAEGQDGDMVTVTGSGFISGATVTLDGVTAKVRSVGDTTVVVAVPIGNDGAMDVVVTNPSGQSGILPKGFTYKSVSVSVSLTVSPSAAKPGDLLTLTWSAPDRTISSPGDWIALFKAGAPDPDSSVTWRSYGCCLHTGGRPSGNAPLAAPTEPGDYEFRYHAGNSSGADERSIARSGRVSVR